MSQTLNIFAISGSVREQSTNSYLLEFLKENSPNNINIEIYNDLKNLPIFSIDNIVPAPFIIQNLITKIKNHDAILISCPEYIHSIPGGLKNLIDWLVPFEAIIDKHIFLAHASHRGEDLLEQLRLVLRTVSFNFHEDIFIRFGLMNKTRNQVFEILNRDENNQSIQDFFDKIYQNFTQE